MNEDHLTDSQKARLDWILRTCGEICDDWAIDHDKVTIEFTGVQRGEATYYPEEERWEIQFPLWLFFEECEPFFHYYTIHEMVHVVTYCSNHTKRFKELEKEICRIYANIEIEHRGAYASRIFDFNNNLLWTRGK